MWGSGVLRLGKQRFSAAAGSLQVGMSVRHVVKLAREFRGTLFICWKLFPKVPGPALPL